MSSSSRFQDRRVVVTGAGSGFGREIAKRFADEGAKVVIADLDAQSGERVAAAIRKGGGVAHAIPTDVSKSTDVERLIDGAIDSLGGLDILVNNAGFSHRAMPLWELPEADFDRVFAVNTRGVFLGCKFGVPALRDHGDGNGVIVNIASIGAVSPRPGVTAYNATKAAVVTLTRGLATETASLRIRVNAVNPVAADTAFMKGALGVDSLGDETRDILAQPIPLGRLAEPADVAAAVLFLASTDASFLTGVCLDVDGGRSIS